MNRLLYESHLHTPLCKHATGNPADYAAVAHAKHLKGILVTCHNPMPDGYSSDVRMAEDQFPAYIDLVAQARAHWAGTIDVRLGLECDFAPGFERYLEKQIASAPLHHVLGSVHPQVREHRARYFTGDALAYQKLYFEHLALAAETRLFDTLSHPDLVKNESPATWNPAAVWPDILRALDRIAKTGVAMELNTSGLSKAVREFNPGPAVLREMAARQIPVVLGADAHHPSRVADKYPQPLETLSQTGHTMVHFYLDRHRHAVPIPTAQASLTPTP